MTGMEPTALELPGTEAPRAGDRPQRPVAIPTAAPAMSLSDPEVRLLRSLSKKYAPSEQAGRARSYVIAVAVLLLLFAIARWVPWWPLALGIVQGLGLLLFHQYKRFARFKTRLLVKLWTIQSRTESGHEQSTS